jgi:hypothetical protein
MALLVLIGGVLFLPYVGGMESTGATPSKLEAVADAVGDQADDTMVDNSSNASVKMVKKGSIALDKSVTVGNAFDGYQYFSQRAWSAITDPQKRKIVQFRGRYDFDKFVGVEIPELGGTLDKDMVKKAKAILGPAKIQYTYTVQFALSKEDDTFEVKYSGIEMRALNKDTGKMVTEDLPDEEFKCLQNIYTNKPEPAISVMIIQSSLATESQAAPNPATQSAGVGDNVTAAPTTPDGLAKTTAETMKPEAPKPEPVRRDITFRPFDITFKDTPDSVKQKNEASTFLKSYIGESGTWEAEGIGTVNGRSLNFYLKEPFKMAEFDFGGDGGELMMMVIRTTDIATDKETVCAKLVEKYGEPTTRTIEKAEWLGTTEELHYDLLRGIQVYRNLPSFNKLKLQVEAQKKQEQEQKQKALDKF